MTPAPSPGWARLTTTSISAATRSCRERSRARWLPGRQYPLLWQHDPSNPIGTAKVTDTPQGLQVEGTLLLQDPTALKAYTFMKAGVIKGMSIGFETLQSTMDGDVRQLKELKLWEISPS